MRILSIRLKHYKGVKEAEVEFRPTGITVVQGPNEVGKTSLVTALDTIIEYADSSSHREVVAMRPQGQDYGTEIEVQLQMDQEILTYFKRYHRDRTTRLTIEKTGSGRRSMAGREAHDYMRERLIHQMDWELWKALKIVQGSATDDAAHVVLGTSRSLRAALDRAAGGGSGNVTDDTLFDRVKKERDRYFTATGAEIKGMFGGLREELRRSNDEVERITRQMADAENDSQRLHYLDSQLRGSVEELADAEAKWQHAQASLSLIAEIENEQRRKLEQLTLAQEKISEWRGQLTEREQLTRQENELVKQVAISERRLHEGDADSNQLSARLQAAQEEYEIAEKSRREARHAFDERNEDLNSVIMRQELAGLTHQIERIRELNQLLSTCRQRRERIRIDEVGLKKIRKQSDIVRLAQSALQVKSPSAVIRSMQPTTLILNGVKVALDDHEVRNLSLSEKFTVVDPDRFEMTVYPGTSVSELQSKLGVEQNALSKLFDQYGVQDLNDAESQSLEQRTLETQIDSSQRQLDDESAGLSLADLETRMLELTVAMGHYEENRPEGYVFPDALEVARKQAEDARRVMEQAEEIYHDATHQCEALKKEQQRLQDERQTLLAEMSQNGQQLSDMRYRLEERRRILSDERLTEHLETGTLEVQTLKRDVETLVQRLENLEPEHVRVLVNNGSEQIATIKQRSHELRQERAEIQGRLNAVGGLGLYEELEEAKIRYEGCKASLDQLTRRAQAAKLLYETVNDCREREQLRYREPLRQRITELGRAVFGSDFDVQLDETLSVVSRTYHGDTLPVEVLSTGAQEQLALLVRLAAASLVDRDDGVPIILDDTLGHTDDERMDMMASVLNVVGQSAQIIVLTSATRRYSSLRSAQVIDLWTPVHSINVSN